MNDYSLIEGIGYMAAYFAVGAALLILAAWAVDLLTPGKLAEQLMAGGRVTHRRIYGSGTVAESARDDESSQGAGLFLAAALVAQGFVIATAIYTNGGAGFGDGLAWTVTFGLAAIALQAAAFTVLDLLTPGKLGEVVCVRGPAEPAAYVAAALQLAVAMLLFASMT